MFGRSAMAGGVYRAACLSAEQRALRQRQQQQLVEHQPQPPLLLGPILGGPIETYFLQATVLCDSVWQAMTRPVCLLLLVLTILTVALSLRQELSGRKESA